MAPSPTALAEQVYGSLRDCLDRGALLPGRKLTIKGVASELRVSRSPAHQALTRLVSEGALSVRPRRGYFVVELTREEVGESFDLMLAIELHAATRMVAWANVRRGQAARHLAECLPADGDRVPSWDGVAVFNRRLVELVENEALLALYDRILRRIPKPAASTDAERVLHAHDSIVRSLRSGDRTTLEQATRRDSEARCVWTLDSLEASDLSPPVVLELPALPSSPGGSRGSPFDTHRSSTMKVGG